MRSAILGFHLCLLALAAIFSTLSVSGPIFAQSFPDYLIDLRIEGCRQDALSNGYDRYAQAVIPATMSTICIYGDERITDRSLVQEAIDRCRKHLRTQQRAIFRAFGEATDCRLIQLNGKLTDLRLVRSLRGGDAPVSMKIYFAPTQQETSVSGLIRLGRYINAEEAELQLLFTSGKVICSGTLDIFQSLPSGTLVAESYSVQCPNGTQLSGTVDRQIRGMYYFGGQFITIFDATLRDKHDSYIRVKSIIPEGAVVFRG